MEVSISQDLKNGRGKVLKVSEEERDLGVIMHRSAKPLRQCAEASKKANSTLGMIRRTIVTRDKDTILRGCTNHWLRHSWNTASRHGVRI